MTSFHKISVTALRLFRLGMIACFSSALLITTPLLAEDYPVQDAPQERGYIPDDTGPDYTSPDYTREAPKSITPEYKAPVQRDYEAPSQRQYQGRNDRRGKNYNERPVTSEEYNSNEILEAGGSFFGSISVGMAKVVEHAFKSKGRPNGYILGEEAGGALIAGLRYGEGTLYTKSAGRHKVYWQGPSIGYDFGASGSKTMILAYNLYNPSDVYRTFGGVAGSAYFIGGVGITFMQRDHVNLAPIVSGVGVRIGANVGYLKFTRAPTWNPF